MILTIGNSTINKACMKYKHVISHAAVVLTMVKMIIQSASQLGEYSKNNMMFCKVWIRLDQALFLITNPLFKDYHWVEWYNTTAKTYSVFNSDEHRAQC